MTRRLMMAVLLMGVGYGLLPAQAQAQQCPGISGWVFDDVPASDPFCAQITWLAQNGITLGCQVIDAGHRLYCPTNNVNRTQMAAFLERLAQALFPLNCTAGQAMRWNGGDWVCASDPPGTPGPQGPVGPSGPQGAAGATGPAGPAGAAGPAGLQGPTGATGAQGPAGAQGTTGVQGPVGATGAQGPAGTSGRTLLSGGVPPTGSVGADGDFYIDTVADTIYGPKTAGAWGAATSIVGPQGPAGTDGAAGAQGPAGATGPQGPTGTTGAQGPIGLTGPAGATGATGLAGAQGATGATGDVGPQGPAGTNGTNGLDGRTVRNGLVPPTAVDGVDGDFWIDTLTDLIYGPKVAGAWGAGTALVGPQGPAGTDGAAGAQGPAGATGPQGPTGTTGAQGPIGLTGPAGATGATGSAGAQGPAGPQGTQGVQGPAGPTGAVATVSNGLTLSGSDARLGGALTVDTGLSLETRQLLVVGPAPSGSLMAISPTSRISAGAPANFHMQGSMSHPITEVSSAGTYNVAENEYTLLCTPNGGAAINFVLPTPSAVNRGRVYVLKRTNANVNGTCTVTSSGGTVDGVASRTLTGPGGNSANSPSAFIVQSSGAGGSWWVVGIAP